MTSAPQPRDGPALVTVIVPAYNAGRFVAEAVRSAQAQTHPHVEILVVDDGSTDDTAAQVQALADRDPRIRLIRQPNRGVAAARNRGLAEARGAFVAPLDADDRWHPEKLARQLRAMEDEAVGMVYTGWERCDRDGRPLPDSARTPRVEGWLADRFVRSNLIACASVPLFRKACLDRVGGYDDHRPIEGAGCEDWDLYLRVAERYPVAAVPEPLVGYRQSDRSMSTDSVRMKRSYDRMIARLVARRPALPPALLRQSRHHFYRYLAGIARRNGRHLRAWYWHGRSAVTRPEAFVAEIPRRSAARLERVLPWGDRAR
ncbi:MAG: glycosyltransferase family 2 protein [Rubricoccaceae bacterium]|nr:glycosyltransferase family 2 protein [Rubricoccaceae bacterium]